MSLSESCVTHPQRGTLTFPLRRVLSLLFLPGCLGGTPSTVRNVGEGEGFPASCSQCAVKASGLQPVDVTTAVASD